MYDLHLATNLEGWRIFMGRKADKAFRPFAEKILDRDNYCCQFCSFQAQKFQEIVNLDGNYKNNSTNNLVTACCFCSQCLFIESVGLDGMSGGQLIHLPEMSQAQLNSFCHVLFCAMGNGTGYQDTSQDVYRSLKFRTQLIESKFGAGTSNPQTFGQLMLEYKNTKGSISNNLLKDLRILPSHAKFERQLTVWAEDALAEMSED